jgi:hypothetical protein
MSFVPKRRSGKCSSTNVTIFFCIIQEKLKLFGGGALAKRMVRQRRARHLGSAIVRRHLGQRANLGWLSSAAVAESWPPGP